MGQYPEVTLDLDGREEPILLSQPRSSYRLSIDRAEEFHAELGDAIEVAKENHPDTR